MTRSWRILPLCLLALAFTPPAAAASPDAAPDRLADRIDAFEAETDPAERRLRAEVLRYAVASLREAERIGDVTESDALRMAGLLRAEIVGLGPRPWEEHAFPTAEALLFAVSPLMRHIPSLRPALVDTLILSIEHEIAIATVRADDGTPLQFMARTGIPQFMPDLICMVLASADPDIGLRADFPAGVTCSPQPIGGLGRFDILAFRDGRDGSPGHGLPE